jgi:hypothetical protein
VSPGRRVVSLVTSIVVMGAALVTGLATVAWAPAAAATPPVFAYVVDQQQDGMVTPIDLATNTPGTPIPVGRRACHSFRVSHG